MKIPVYFFILVMAQTATGQDYNLFHADSKKLFTTSPAAGLTSGIAFDSVTISGNESVYFNYAGLGGEFESDTCIFWGGPLCYKQDRPLWLGAKIFSDQAGIYHFITGFNDSLSFNFNLSPGDSAMFYEDPSQHFYMIFEGADTATILELQDSVKYYRVAHYDGSGNIINSPLNSALIKLGKELGLAGFFRVDSFPLVLQPVSLLGNTAPEAGMISLTNEMVYDHHAGDEVQYYDRYYNMGGPPWTNYLNYIKHSFLDRTDTQDSVVYTVKRQIYKTDSNLLIQDTIVLRYNRHTIVAEIPFDKLEQNASLAVSRFYLGDYCERKFWAYSHEPQYLVYCAEDNCWGNYDIPGPPPDEETVFVCGLGKYLERSAVSAPPPEGYSYYKSVIYFKKDGIECGEEVIVNINEVRPLQPDFIIYPNPAKSKLFINTKEKAGNIQLYSVNGLQIREIIVEDRLSEIDVSDLPAGIYIVKFIGASSVEFWKVIIQ